jgi:hypothetical protein
MFFIIQAVSVRELYENQFDRCSVALARVMPLSGAVLREHAAAWAQAPHVTIARLDLPHP